MEKIIFSKYGKWKCPHCKQRHYKHNWLCVKDGKLYKCECGFEQIEKDKISIALGNFIDGYNRKDYIKI